MMQKYQDSSLSPEERASDLLARMDLDEKFGQIQCYNAIDSFLGKSVEKQNPYGVGQVCILIATMLDDVGSVAGLIATASSAVMWVWAPIPFWIPFAPPVLTARI